MKLKILLSFILMGCSPLLASFYMEENFRDVEEHGIDFNWKSIEVSPYIGFGIGPLPISYPSPTVGTKFIFDFIELDVRLCGVYTESFRSSKASLSVNWFIRQSEKSTHFIGVGGMINSLTWLDDVFSIKTLMMAPRFVFGKKSPSEFGKRVFTELEMCFPYFRIKDKRSFYYQWVAEENLKWVPSFSISTGIEF